MVKCIFSLGIIDKKLIIPLLTTISYIIYFSYLENYPTDDVDVYFHYLGTSIGEIIVFFEPYIFRFKINRNNKNGVKKICIKNNILDYFFFILFYSLRRMCVFYVIIFLIEIAILCGQWRQSK